MSREKLNESDLYVIQAISNIHVGSGDNNFGIIDNQVQRDVITHRPIINSSSLKGALREFFDPYDDNETNFVKYVFGSHPVRDRGNDSQKGAFSFLSANLIALPLRANTKAFFRATSPALIGELLNNVTLFNITLEQEEKLRELIALEPKEDTPIIFENLENTVIEDMSNARFDGFDTSALTSLLGEDIALLHNRDLDKYCQNLPVIARNHLEDGVSQNLWYEEVVPRESRFYFICTKPSNLDMRDKNRIKRFEGIFETEKMVQIGANATIGYGYTNIKKVSK